jgi:putative ABC transport system substrate-binding protein
MEAGALVSYGVKLADVFRDVADFVDQVARGAKAGDVPMREPSHYHIAFNLKTARDLGVDVPTSLLARADEVIE